MTKRVRLDCTQTVIELFSSDEPKTATVMLMKLSECHFGKVGIVKIVTDGEPHPTEEKPLKIEFVGDSITCGYGIEGKLAEDAFFKTSQQNPWNAYAALTARALNADFNLVSWSGIGVISCYCDNPENGPDKGDFLSPELYPYADTPLCRTLDIPCKKWDFSSFVPDVIVVNLGTNDASYTRNIPALVEEFGIAYEQYIRYIRSCNPSSKIVCTMGIMNSDLNDEIRSRAEKIRSEGDKNISFMAFDMQREEDGLGTNWHPSEITHRKAADKLTAYLTALLKEK